MATSTKQRALNIKRATSKARKQYDNYELSLLQDIYTLYGQSADTITAQILKYESDGVVPPKYLKQISDMIKSEMKALNTDTLNMIRSGISDTVDYSIKQQVKILNATTSIDPDLIRVGSQAEFRQLNTAAIRAVMKWQPTGETLSTRIWKNLKTTQKEILKQTRIGVVTGESAQKLSRRIRPYLIEPDKLFRRVRGKTGKLIQSKAMKAYNPGQGVYKSAYKNAMREARTSYARAYNEGIVEYSNSKDFITGWISRIGSSDPAPYDMSVNGKFFKKSRGIDIPYHPQCMCHAEMVTTETDQSKLKPAMSRTQFNKSVLESLS